MSQMSRLEFGRLTEAWAGEAADFTPLLNEQLDALGRAIDVELDAIGQSEVLVTGGRRIDIVANVADGSEFVVENQYGRGDHDHLTRGLAYAVARRARGLVVVAEEHRGEFRAVAQYLNDLAEQDPDRGIAVWLVEARAVRIDGSAWAPLFTTVVEPNEFTSVVEQEKQASTNLKSLDAFWAQFASDEAAAPVRQLVETWTALGHRLRLGPNHAVLEARGPSTSGVRTVVAVYSDARVMVPFHSYAGQNSGIPIDSLTTPEFRTQADALFGFTGSERLARTASGWLDDSRLPALVEFCTRVAAEYASAVLPDHQSAAGAVD